MGDRHWRWGCQTVGVAAFEERDRLMAAEPAGVLQLDLVDLQLSAFGFSKAADHQRGGERPWLRGKVLHRATDDTGLLADFAPDGGLDGFPGLDETGQRRIHALWKPRLTAKQTGIAIHREHDDDRIGAREVDRFANRAIPPPARHRDLSRRAAIRAEAVARVPVHERLGRRQHRSLVLRHEAAHRDRPQVDELQVFATRDDQNAPIEKAVTRVRVQFDSLVRQKSDKDWRANGRETQERFDLRPAKRRDLAHRKEWIESLFSIPRYRHLASDQERARILAGPQASDLDGTLAPIGSAIEPVDDVAKTFKSRQS